MHSIDLIEHGPSRDEPLEPAIARALRASGLVKLRRLPEANLWRLTPGAKIGAVSAGTCDADRVQVNVTTKIPVDRVIYLLEHSSPQKMWQDGPVHVEQDEYLLRAVAEAFERLTRRALVGGLLQGYRTVEETTSVVRGRIRESDQLRRQFGLPVPVEVRYDDYTVDTGENRLLRAAATRARQFPRLGTTLSRRLEHLERHFSEVTAVRDPRDLIRYRPDRLHGRFGDALRLAQVIMDSSSFERRRDGLVIDGFVINMAKVFEDFVCSALGDALCRAGGVTRTQETWHLDRERSITLCPDLLWYPDGGGGPPDRPAPLPVRSRTSPLRSRTSQAPSGTDPTRSSAPGSPAAEPDGTDDPRRPGAVIDAKYKAEKSSGFPNADLYQMLAYCTSLGLSAGHLVYAQGDEPERVYRMARSPITVHVHTLDLSQPPGGLLAQVHALGQAITATAG